ncbi:MAG: metallophosphoesterase family protein, partial [Lysobacteraceae bacterium]
MTSRQGDIKDGQGQGFTWLHLSDLHVGQHGQTRLFPRFQSNLASDLEALSRRVERPFDLVIFSGDLVQKGLAEEFAQFDEILTRILGEIERFQDRPQIITVPGNHDLVRPDSLNPMSIAVKQYWSNEVLREALWDKRGENYRDFICDNFANYNKWRQSSIDKGIHVKPYREGIFPGDSTYRLSIRNKQLGVVALNTAWLQISGSEYRGELHADTHQLLEITNQDPDRWVQENDVSLLVTHHPVSWLREQGGASWSNDIDPPSRFDAHLFGHMHKHETESRSRGGSLPRRTLQAASLFGLEKHSDDYDRTHGYAA